MLYANNSEPKLQFIKRIALLFIQNKVRKTVNEHEEKFYYCYFLFLVSGLGEKGWRCHTSSKEQLLTGTSSFPSCSSSTPCLGTCPCLSSSSGFKGANRTSITSWFICSWALARIWERISSFGASRTFRSYLLDFWLDFDYTKHLI